MGFYLIESFPNGMADWELRTIHPLYGVAWLGLGLALSLVAEATQRGIRAWTLRSWGLALPLGKTSQESRPPIRIVSASNLEEAKGLIDRRGVRFIVIPSWDSYLDEYAQNGMGQLEGTSIARLHAWNITRWLRPMAFHLPAGADLGGQSVTIFEVVDDQDEALALSRLAQYFVEMNRMDLAVGAARGLRRYPTDLDSWIARAEVATATGNEEAAGGALKLIIPE